MLNLKNLSVPTFFYIIYIDLLNFVAANYCEFGICDEEQYCCGDNRCCKLTGQVLYFWAGILLIAIAIFVVICLYFGRKKNNNGYKRVLCDDREPIL